MRTRPDRSVTGDVEGAVVVAQERQPERGGPQVDPALDGDVAPPAVGLQPVVAPAQRRDIPRSTSAPPWPWAVMWSQSASCSPGRQPRAGRVQNGNTQVRRAARRLRRSGRGPRTGVDVDVVVQVDHRLHHHRGVGVGAPGADLLGGDQRPGVLQPAEVTAARVGDRGVGAGARTAPPAAPCAACRAAAASRRARRSPARLRSRVCWRRASSPTAAARRTSSDSVDPSALSCSAPAATAASRSRASARSSSPETCAVPAKETGRGCRRRSAVRRRPPGGAARPRRA